MIPTTAFLIGDRIYLRPLQIEDSQGPYVSWLNDREVCSGNSHHIFPNTIEDIKQYISDSNIKKGNNLILAIILTNNNSHIGNIALQKIEFINRSADLSIIIGEKSLWGKGYAKEAAIVLISHAFLSLNLRRITCGTFDTNISMQYLARSLGMIEEGRRRQAVFKEGKYVDIIEYGLLKREFQTEK
jgi:[ribosomal protein S5]-alanine N-acetyltransferase